MFPAGRNPEIAFGVLLTIVAHAAFVGLLSLVAGFGGDEPDTILLPVVSTELLMLGDVMPEDGELPWIANPEPAPQNPEPAEAPTPPEEETTLPQQETVVLNAPAEAEQVREENRPVPEQSNPERAPRQDRGETNENRPTNDRPRMGSPDGYVGGTSLSAQALQNQFAGLVAQLGRALRRPSSIPDAEYRRLEALIQIRTTSEGRITNWEFVESSGNQIFDSAVSSMLNRFRTGSDRLRLSTVSNEDLRARMISEGFRIPVRGN